MLYCLLWNGMFCVFWHEWQMHLNCFLVYQEQRKGMSVNGWSLRAVVCTVWREKRGRLPGTAFNPDWTNSRFTVGWRSGEDCTCKDDTPVICNKMNVRGGRYDVTINELHASGISQTDVGDCCGNDDQIKPTVLELIVDWKGLVAVDITKILSPQSFIHSNKSLENSNFLLLKFFYPRVWGISTNWNGGWKIETGGIFNYTIITKYESLVFRK